MKLNIRCAKCQSGDVEIIAEEGNPIPMYKCNKCGYKNNLFPQFKNKEEESKKGEEKE